ncbi:MAG: [protein-PII] uridylyltransferase [Candidatus Hydrogenedentota bacterium]
MNEFLELKDFFKNEKERLIDLNKKNLLYGKSFSTQLSETYDLFIHKIAENFYAEIKNDICIVATGSYGRKELNPYSDIDLIIILNREFKNTETLNQFLYTLWDAGLKMGYSTRTVDECINYAKNDIIIRTSLLEIRYVWGDENLYKELDKIMVEEFTGKNYEDYLINKIDELYKTHSSYTKNPLPVEPDIKKSPGGLRDIHNLLWIGRLIYGARELKNILDIDFFTDEERLLINESYEIFIEIRNRLHRLYQKKKDIIQIEIQDKIGLLFGFTPKETEHIAGNDITTGEIWMQDLLKRMLTIAQLVRAFFEWHHPGIEAKRQKARETGQSSEVIGGFIKIDDTVYFEDRDIFNREIKDIKSVLELLLCCQVENLTLSETVLLWMKRGFKRIGHLDRKQKMEFFKYFVNTMKIRCNLSNTITGFLRSGFLSLLFPDFDKFECFYRRDAYHHYTVDIHTLGMFSHLDEIIKGQGYIRKIYNSIENVDILHIGILFHDLGKIYGHNHSQTGATATAEFLTNMGYDEKNKKVVQELIKKHLLMNHLAIRRDTDDDDVLEFFKSNILDSEFLDYLYILTNLDLMSVAPGVWTEWKCALINNLYFRTKNKLEGGEDEYRDVVKSKCDKIKAVSNINPEIIEKHILGLGKNYVYKYNEAQIIHHLELIEKLKIKMNNANYELDYIVNNDLSFTEMSISTKTRRGLFATLSGVFAYLNINILSADIMTRDDGIALDIFQVTNTVGEPVTDERKWSSFNKIIADVLQGKSDIKNMIYNKKKEKSTANVPVHIRFDNQISDRYTVMEVETEDRIGLLFDIGRVLYSLGISIEFARITTEKFFVLDIFNIVDDVSGEKIEDDNRLILIKEKITEVLKSHTSLYTCEKF